MVIKDDLPWETDVDEILKLHTQLLKGYLKRELEIERDRLLEKIFDKTLEQIFIENRLYKKLETVKSSDKLRTTVAESLTPFHKELSRIPTKEDIEKLLQIPIRRISRFDIDKNQEEIAGLGKELAKVEKDLKNIKQFTINYLKQLIKQYRDSFPRRTKLGEIQELDKKAIAVENLKIGIDLHTGFVGTKVAGKTVIEGTNFDKLLVMYQDGSYRVMNIPEKDYVHSNGNKAVYIGLADKKTVFNVAYEDPKSHIYFAKRFVVKQFILDKEYRYFDEGMSLAHLSTLPKIELEVQFIPKIKQKLSKMTFPFSDVLIKGVSAKGKKISSRGVKKVKPAKS